MCSPDGGEARRARGQPLDDVTKASLRLVYMCDVTRTYRDVIKTCLDRIGVCDVIKTFSKCFEDDDVTKTCYSRVNSYDVTDILNKPCEIRPRNTCGHRNHTSTLYCKSFNHESSEDGCCCRQRCTVIKNGKSNTSTSCCSGNDTINNGTHNTGLCISRRANKRNRSSPNSHTKSPLIVSRLKLDARPQHPLLLLLLLLLACSSSSSTARGPFAAAHCEKGVKFFNDQLSVCEPCSECRLPYIKIIPCYQFQDTTCATPGDYFDVKGREGSPGIPTAVQEEVEQDDSLGRRREDGGVGRRGGDGGGRNNAENRGRKRNRLRNKGRRGEGKNRNNRNRGNRGRNNDGGRRENPNYWGNEENRFEEEFQRPDQDSDDNYLGQNGHSNFESEDVVGDFKADQKHGEVFSTEVPRRHGGGEGSVQSPVARNTGTSLSVSTKRSDFSGSPATAASNSAEDIIFKASVHEAVSASTQDNSTGLVVTNSPLDSHGAVLPPSSTTEDEEDASLRLSLREMVSSGWTAAVVVCAALLLGLLAIALLLLLALNLLIHFKNKIVSHLKEKRSEVGSSDDGSDPACPSTAVLMHQSPSSLSSSPLGKEKLPKKPKKLGRGLGRVPSGKVLVARTYKLAPGGRGDKLDSSNSSSSGCGMRQSTSTVLTSADTFLSGGSDGTFCAETTLTSETSTGRHKDFNRVAKETSFSFEGKETILSRERGGGKESSFGFVSTSVTPAVGPHARWSSRSSSTPNTALLGSPKQNDKLLAATLPLVGGGHGTQSSPMHVVNSVVTNNIVTFGDGSTVSTTTNYSANAADGDNHLNYPYAHTLPTTYIRTSTRTQALMNNNSHVGGNFNGSSHGSPVVGPSVVLIAGSPHPTAEPMHTLTSVSEAKGSPIPYTMDKLLEQRRRLGCASSVDTNIYVEMWRGSSAAPSNAPSAAPSPALHRSNNTAPTGGRGSTFTPSTGGPLDRSARHTSDDQRTAFVTAVQRDLNNLSINNSGYNSNHLAQLNAGLNDLNCGGDRVAADGENLTNGGLLVLVGRSATNSPALQRHPALVGGNHGMGGGCNQGIVGAKLGMVGGNHTTGNTNLVLVNNINHAVGNSGYGGTVVSIATGSPLVLAGRLNDRLTAHLNSVPAGGGGMPASTGPALRHMR